MISVDPTFINQASTHNAPLAKEVRVMASCQYLCGLAYTLSEGKIPLPASILVLMEDGRFEPYSVASLNLSPELYGYYLFPENNDNKEVKVVFRGTDCSSAKSLLINAEPWGPGMSSFNQDKQTLFERFRDWFKKHTAVKQGPYSLHVYGHSQGGALAQLFIHEWLRQRLLHQDFDNVSTLKMSVQNSPGVPSVIVQEADERVVQQSIHKKRLSITANFGMVGGDPVQTQGFDMILVRFPHLWADINLMKVDKGLEGHWIKDLKINDGIQPYEIYQLGKNLLIGFFASHPVNNFFGPKADGKINVNAPYRLYSNKNHKDITPMLAELLNKKTWIPALFYTAEELVVDAGLFPYLEALSLGLSYGSMRIKDWGVWLMSWLTQPKPQDNVTEEWDPNFPVFVPYRQAKLAQNEKAATNAASSTAQVSLRSPS